eukprot:344303-Chlamydomonas_euryale.AAC.4
MWRPSPVAAHSCSLITALDKGSQWQLAEQVSLRPRRYRRSVGGAGGNGAPEAKPRSASGAPVGRTGQFWLGDTRAMK